LTKTPFAFCSKRENQTSLNSYVACNNFYWLQRGKNKTLLNWVYIHENMINSSMFLEKFLQNYRFKMVRPYLIGDVLDFGGNEGELKKLVKGKYLAVNYDHSVMKNNHYDTIVS